MTNADIRDAATIVLLRPGRPFEIFMVLRHPKSGFGAGMWVFPGGKVDDADCDADATTTGLDDAGAAKILGDAPLERARGHFVAAIRETFEEAGVLLAVGRTLTDESLRARFNDGEITFAEVLSELGAVADLSRLRYLDHWVTPAFERRRFSARFFLAEVPASQAAVHDDHETTAGIWIRAKDALARCNDQDDPVQMMPPTIRMLQRMSWYDTIEGAMTEAPHAPVPPIEPQLAMVDGKPNLVLPGDPLHPTEPGDSRARFRIDGRRFTPIFDADTLPGS